MKKTLKILVWSCLAITLAAPCAMAGSDDNVNDDAAVARNLDIFNSLYKELNTFYVDTINAQKAIENAINAMLNEIDPYTEYIPAVEADEFMTMSTGEYGGIGSYLTERTVNGKKGVYISGPYEGSPAARVGLRAGDRIIVIDGDSTTGWTSDKVSKRLRGQANTHLTLTVVRPYDEDSIKTFSFNRETISVNPVPYYGVTRDNIGYIGLTTFNEKSAQQVRDAVIELKKDPRVKGIVLDLRSNGGGIVEGAIQIVGCFVPKGTQVLVMRGRDKSSERTYKTTVDPVDTEIPLAVIIDGGSASASEITAGALQDLDRAVIIGNRSFGKGLVQSTRSLPYDGMFAQAYYLLQNGFNYWFDIAEIKSLESHVDEFMIPTSEEELIPIYFSPAKMEDAGSKFLTLAEISAKIVAFGNLKKNPDPRRLGAIMTRLGFTKERKGHLKRRGYYVREHIDSEIQQMHQPDVF